MRTVITALIALLFSGSLRAQLPVDRESHHKVLLDNGYIRLLEGKIAVNDTTPLHRHAANSVIVFLSESTFGIQTPGGRPGIATVHPGDVKYAAYGDHPVDHIVWVQAASGAHETPDGSQPLLHFFVVELKRHPDLRDTLPTIRRVGLRILWREPQATAYAIDLPDAHPWRLPAAPAARFLVPITGRLNAGDRMLVPGQFAFFPPNHPVTLAGVAGCVLIELP